MFRSPRFICIRKPSINLSINAHTNCCLSTSLEDSQRCLKLFSNHYMYIQSPLNLFDTMPGSYQQIGLQSSMCATPVTTASSTCRLSCNVISLSVIVHSLHERWNLCVLGLHLSNKALISVGSNIVPTSIRDTCKNPSSFKYHSITRGALTLKLYTYV